MPKTERKIKIKQPNYRKKDDGFICAVVRHLNDEGFLMTAYFTEAIKEGELVWKR